MVRARARAYNLLLSLARKIGFSWAARRPWSPPVNSISRSRSPGAKEETLVPRVNSPPGTPRFARSTFHVISPTEWYGRAKHSRYRLSCPSGRTIENTSDESEDELARIRARARFPDTTRLEVRVQPGGPGGHVRVQERVSGRDASANIFVCCYPSKLLLIWVPFVYTAFMMLCRETT